MGLFDWLDIIKKMLDDEKQTQEQIGLRIGWSINRFKKTQKNINTQTKEEICKMKKNIKQ